MILTYDKEAGRFRDDQGNLINLPIVVQTMEGIFHTLESEISSITTRWRGHVITDLEWLAGMQTILDGGYILAASVAAGGRDQVTPLIWTSVAAVLATEYGFLQRFAQQRAAGVVTDSLLVPRAKRYVANVRRIFSDIYSDIQAPLKQDVWCRRRRTAGESCRDCVRWAGYGWMPYSQMARIGTLLCGQYCKCYLEFREGPPPSP